MDRRPGGAVTMPPWSPLGSVGEGLDAETQRVYGNALRALGDAALAVTRP